MLKSPFYACIRLKRRPGCLDLLFQPPFLVVLQDPIKASDSTLNSCGPYILDEQDAMVYRRPFLTAGMAGFALTAVTRALNKDLKVRTGFCWSRQLYCLLNIFPSTFCLERRHLILKLVQSAERKNADLCA
jgi:hypothetical protein